MRMAHRTHHVIIHHGVIHHRVTHGHTVVAIVGHPLHPSHRHRARPLHGHIHTHMHRHQHEGYLIRYGVHNVEHVHLHTHSPTDHRITRRTSLFRCDTARTLIKATILRG